VVRRRVVVRGLVQGVGFRMFVVSRARTREVRGWVRNRADGTLEAVFEGEDEAVNALVGLCREGPRGAEVESIDVVDEPAEGVVGFEVR
jgi:acylphosphatase